MKEGLRKCGVTDASSSLASGIGAKAQENFHSGSRGRLLNREQLRTLSEAGFVIDDFRFDQGSTLP